MRTGCRIHKEYKLKDKKKDSSLFEACQENVHGEVRLIPTESENTTSRKHLIDK